METPSGAEVSKTKKAKLKAKENPASKPNRYMDSDIKKLDDLHERSGVTSNLSLTDGQRITLSSTGQQSAPVLDSVRRSKPKPEFNVVFTALEDNHTTPTASINGISSDSDVELPDVHDLIRNGLSKPQSMRQTASDSSTSYGDSDIDLLIQQAPVDAIIDLTHEVVDASPTPAVAAESLPSPKPLAHSNPKRSNKEASPSRNAHTRPAKRVRYILPSPSDDRFPCDQYIIEPLFYPGSSDDNERTYSSAPPNLATSVPPTMDEAGFILDESLFDFVDASPDATRDAPKAAPKGAPIVPPATRTSAALQKKALSTPKSAITPSVLEKAFYARQKALSHNSRASSTDAPPSPNSAPANGASSTSVPNQHAASSPEDGADPLAELEEWLATTTEIVWM
jgi:hypothetical protein